jgi:Hypothetical protein (DUF2513)
MKRDMKLIRELMLAIESHDGSKYWAEDLEITGDRDISEIKYHLQLLVEAGFINANIENHKGSDSPYILIDGILWNGHEFLDNAQNESIWGKTMEIVKEKGGSVSVGVLTQLLTSAAKQHFGLS